MSHGQDGEDSAGLVARGQRVSSDAASVDIRVLVAVSVGRDVRSSMGGRMLQWRRNRRGGEGAKVAVESSDGVAR